MKKPCISNGILTNGEGHTIPLSNPHWLDYLAKQSCWVNLSDHAPIKGFSLRREMAKGEHPVWYAYKRIGGKLQKRYIGTEEWVRENLTQNHLEAVAADLVSPPKPKPESYSEPDSDKVTELQNEVTELRETLTKAQKALHGALAKVEWYNSQNTTLRDENAQLQKRVEELDQEVGEWVAKHGDLEAELLKLQSQVTEQKTEPNPAIEPDNHPRASEPEQQTNDLTPLDPTLENAVYLIRDRWPGQIPGEKQAKYLSNMGVPAPLTGKGKWDKYKVSRVRNGQINAKDGKWVKVT